MKVMLVCALVLLLTACTDAEPRVFGTVERDRLTLAAPVGEIIASVNVREGQTVRAGEVLLTLDSHAARLYVDQRQAEFAEARAKLAELVAGARKEDVAQAQALLAEAQAKLQETQQGFIRSERLFNSQMQTQADLDGARAARDTARAKQAQAQQQLNTLTNGTRSERLDQGRAVVAGAAARLALAQKAMMDLSLVATQDAVVDVLPWQVGDRVAAGTQLISLLAIEQPYVRVYLPATWLSRVKLGSPVKIHLDGQAMPLDGVVRHIRSQPAYTPFYALNERDRARLMYLTDISLPAQAQDLPSGLALEVSLP